MFVLTTYGYYPTEELALEGPAWTELVEGAPGVVFAAGREIYAQGEAADRFYFVRAGEVRAFVSAPDGSQRTVTIYRAGDIMGHASFFSESTHIASCTALTRCELVALRRAEVEALFARQPDLAFVLLKYVARSVQLFSHHLADASFRGAEERFALMLLSHHRKGQSELRYSQEEVGAFIGVSRVTVSRMIGQFAEQGWIESGYSTIRILDAQALERIAHSE